MTGLTVNKINQPNIKDAVAKIKNILKFEYPKIFKVRRSLLFLKWSINHILEIKIIKGINLVIIFGIYSAVSVSGIKIEVFVFLKNSISSKRFKITPKE